MQVIRAMSAFEVRGERVIAPSRLSKGAAARPREQIR